MQPLPGSPWTLVLELSHHAVQKAKPCEELHEEAHMDKN